MTGIEVHIVFTRFIERCEWVQSLGKWGKNLLDGACSLHVRLVELFFAGIFIHDKSWLFNCLLCVSCFTSFHRMGRECIGAVHPAVCAHDGLSCRETLRRYHSQRLVCVAPILSLRLLLAPGHLLRCRPSQI